MLIRFIFTVSCLIFLALIVSTARSEFELVIGGLVDTIFIFVVFILVLLNEKLGDK